MRRWISLLRHTTLVFVILATGLALVLFSVKYEVQDLEIELSDLERQIAGERRALHVLEAEWSYLTEAGRLRELAERHLDLGPLAPRQIGSFAALTEPASPGAPTAPADDGTPASARLAALAPVAPATGRSR